MDRRYNFRKFLPRYVELGANYYSEGAHEHHSGNMTLVYVLEGYVRYIYRGQIFEAEQGDLIFTPDASSYYSAWYGKPNVRFYTLSFYFEDRTIFKEYGVDVIKKYPRELFDKIVLNYPDNMFKSLSAAYELISNVFDGKISNIIPLKQCVSIYSAKNYIENHAVESITLEELAKMCNLSKGYFSSVFTKTIGCSPIKYKHSILINMAMDKLLCTDETIDSISEELGFSSSNYFRRIFKNLVGESPADFRKYNIMP